jgi:uncharacterized protein YndB with AHSA1/START domain
MTVGLDERMIVAEGLIPASRAEVWEAFTTAEGAQSFFAPVARIEPVPGGAYELLFDLDAPSGQQGGEGMRVLAVEAPSFLSFTWNAPPELPTVRNQQTFVTVRLAEVPGQEKPTTHVVLRHWGWGTGGEWNDAFHYFERVWQGVVLPRLKRRFEQGPLRWEEL